MTLQSLSVGRLGERLALQFLHNQNYAILKQNFKSRFGEIDIIAQKNSIIHFIEVKTRIDTKKGMPYESVTPRKIRHLQKAAQYYLLQSKKHESKLSLDVISIILYADLSVRSLKLYEIF